MIRRKIMNKEELIKQYDEKAKALRDEFISKLEDDKKEFELTYPEDGETVYYISCADGSIYDRDYCVDNWDDKYMFEHGLLFKTREEAEQHLKESKLIFKIKKWAKIHNDGWVPDWSDIYQAKFNIFYDYYRKGLYFSFNNSTSTIDKLPYFKSKEIAQACINEFGEEIKEVFCQMVIELGENLTRLLDNVLTLILIYMIFKGVIKLIS